jgi:hypothetical protein
VSGETFKDVTRLAIVCEADENSHVYSCLNSIFDVLLLACSVAFLAFALVVNRHDQDSTAEHPRLSKTLVNATKYVLLL